MCILTISLYLLSFYAWDKFVGIWFQYLIRYGCKCKSHSFAHFLKQVLLELIDENGDGNITKDEWQDKIEKVMDKVMHITNVTLTEDYEDLYDDIWEAMDCDNATTISMEVKVLKNSFRWII